MSDSIAQLRTTAQAGAAFEVIRAMLKEHETLHFERYGLDSEAMESVAGIVAEKGEDEGSDPSALIAAGMLLGLEISRQRENRREAA